MATSLEPSDTQGEDTRNTCVEELQEVEHSVPWDHPINSLADTPNLHREGNEPPTRHIPRVGEVRIPQDVKDWIQNRTHNEAVTTARHTSLLNEMHTQSEEVGVRRTEAEAYNVPGPPTKLFVACVIEKGHVVGKVVNRSKKSAIHSASIMIWAVYGRQLMEAKEKSEAATLRSSRPSTPCHFLSEDQSQRVTATRQGELLCQLPIIQHLMVNAEITDDAENLDPRRYLFFDTEGAHGNILWIFDGLILFVGSTFNHDERDHDFVCHILQHAIAHNTLYGFGLADSNDLQTLTRWGVRATRSTIHDLQQDHLSLAASTQQGCKHKVKGIYPHKGIFYAPYTAVFNPDMLWNLVGQVVIFAPPVHNESCTCLDWATYIMAEAAAYSLIHARQSLLGAGEIIIAWPVKKKRELQHEDPDYTGWIRSGIAAWSQQVGTYVCYFDSEGVHRDSNCAPQSTQWSFVSPSAQTWVMLKDKFDANLSQVEDHFPKLEWKSDHDNEKYLGEIKKFLGPWKDTWKHLWEHKERQDEKRKEESLWGRNHEQKNEGGWGPPPSRRAMETDNTRDTPLTLPCDEPPMTMSTQSWRGFSNVPEDALTGDSLSSAAGSGCRWRAS